MSQREKDHIHFYLAVRSIVRKLTKGDTPDTAQMNARVREMIQEALASDGVEEILKMGDDPQFDIFDKDYLEKINKVKLPNTRIKLLQQLLAKAIGEVRKVNKVRGVDFTQKMQTLVQRYNERKEDDVLKSEVYEDFADQITELILEVKQEYGAGDALGIDFEEKAFYDILLALCVKYDFTYSEGKLIGLSRAVKDLVDEQTRFPDWNKRDDIKATLKVELILLLDKHGYPPVERDEVYQDIFEQAENFKKHQKVEKEMIIAHQGHLFIGTNDYFKAEEVFYQYKHFATWLGLEFTNEGEFVQGSWIRRGIEFVQRVFRSKETDELFGKGKKAIELAHLELKQAEVNNKNADAAAKFLTSVKEIPNAASRFGSLVVVKVTTNGEPQVLSGVLTTDQLIALEKNNNLLYNPTELYQRLSSGNLLE